MKKVLVIICVWIWGLFLWVETASANDYNTAVIGHILTETIKGTDLDEGAIMNAETQKLLHTMSLEIIQVVFNNMPNILDGIAADMRMKADKNYKCALQPEEYKNEDCK
tara:strand:+ start:406 stop:732 length:327 start_codon:yes stop_codon:yes gene_type:complete